MIDLKNRVRLSRKDKKYLQGYKPEGKRMQSTFWDMQAIEFKRVKRRIKYQLLCNQDFKCVYCEKLLLNVKREVDHIAPKGEKYYPEFSLELTNLVYSCARCNSDLKGQTDVLFRPNVAYYDFDKMTFKMVHPYYDDVDDHIKYHQNDEQQIDKTASSPKGQYTIELFEMDSMESYLGRLREQRLQQEFEIDQSLLEYLYRGLLEQD